jgi:hypothetical protein
MRAAGRLRSRSVWSSLSLSYFILSFCVTNFLFANSQNTTALHYRYDMQMYCTFVPFVNQHFPGLPASGTHCIWWNILVFKLHDMQLYNSFFLVDRYWHIVSVCCRYKSREEFCSDVRLIFNNCETFNEDDSPVGKAGHSMRSFFETRWGELNGSHPKAIVTPPS